MIITTDEFQSLLTPLLGMPVSMSWRGYGSALFLELGKLTPPRDSRLKYPDGEACVNLNWDWRIENDEKIICGSSDSGPEIDKYVVCLRNLRVNSIKREDETPAELSPEEIEYINLADNTSKRWGEPFSEPLNGNCKDFGAGAFTVIDSDELEDYFDLKEALEAEANKENSQRILWEDVKKDFGLCRT